MLQSSFPRLKDRMIFEEKGERKVILKMMLLLFNLRARVEEINQIKSVYMKNVDVDANGKFSMPLMKHYIKIK